MTRQTIHRCLSFVSIFFVFVVFASPVRGAHNLPQGDEQAVLQGQDHQALRGFLARSRRGNENVKLTDEINQVLLRALPGQYKKACADVAAQCPLAGDKATEMTSRMLYVEDGKEGKPDRALVSYGCVLQGADPARQFRDERLALLKVDKQSSTITMVSSGAPCDTCTEVSTIRYDKLIRLGGRTLVGLTVTKSNENPCSNRAAVGIEERIFFYYATDTRFKPAGSVLLKREEFDPSGTEGTIRTSYTGSAIFKKDMIGNIIGILSPYKLKKGGKEVEKGLLRYNWSSEKEEFVKN